MIELGSERSEEIKKALCIDLRVLESVAAFVASEKFVRETNVAAHAAYGLKIHHSLELGIRYGRS